MFHIINKTSFEEILEYIKTIREQKGREKETLTVIDQALEYGQNFLINLLWEKALTYQHLVMNNLSDKKSLSKMEDTIEMVKFFIEKYKLTKWKSRLFRFLGRISDYKGKYKNSIIYYKKAIDFSKHDPEPFRELELRGFLSYALIMSGKANIGFKMAEKVLKDFEESQAGKTLKKKDYKTWVIWKSGIVIRTISSFISRKQIFNIEVFQKWLEEAEEGLKGGDFSYRMGELKNIRQRLQGV